MALQASRSSRTGRIRTIGTGVGLTVAALLLSTIFGSIVTISMFFAGLTIEDSAVVISLVVAGQLGFLTTGYLYVRRYGSSVQIALPERRDLLYAGGGAVGALVFATTAGAVLAWLGLSPQAVLGETVPKSLTNAVGFVILSTVLVAPAEELSNAAFGERLAYRPPFYWRAHCSVRYTSGTTWAHSMRSVGGSCSSSVSA